MNPATWAFELRPDFPESVWHQPNPPRRREEDIPFIHDETSWVSLNQHICLCSLGRFCEENNQTSYC